MIIGLMEEIEAFEQKKKKKSKKERAFPVGGMIFIASYPLSAYI